jgi:hypothetical protein
MIALAKFQELEQQLNAHIADVVTDAKKQIEDLQTTLRNIALRYPSHESVKTQLQEYLPKNELKVLPIGKKSNSVSGKPRGKKRELPRLKVEYVDGTTVELKDNPSRAKLAKLIKNNPSGLVEIISVGSNGEFSSQIYLTHKDSEAQFRISNPLPFNTSGIKTVSTY